jgi:hypothetical protein
MRKNLEFFRVCTKHIVACLNEKRYIKSATQLNDYQDYHLDSQHNGQITIFIMENKII